MQFKKYTVPLTFCAWHMLPVDRDHGDEQFQLFSGKNNMPELYSCSIKVFNCH